MSAPLSKAEYLYLMRNDFVSFMMRAFIELNSQTELIIAPYIEYMASRLEDCRLGKTRRLIISLPPRYLKSHCASIAYVAWFLGHQPSKQIICASYGQNLSDKMAHDCRKIMSTDWYGEIFPRARLAPDKQSVHDFATTENGYRMSTSVGGVLTGRGGDLIIIDDPLKPEDALSETKRQSVNDWFDSTLLSRLNNKKAGCIVIIMQRLHQDDLVGHVMEQDDWTVVNFPAIAEIDETYEIKNSFGVRTYQRLIGEPLHAERESLAMLHQTRKRIGEYHFSSQYQQNPIPMEGTMVKTSWLQYYGDLPPSDGYQYVLQSWDTAIKTGDLNDFSVCTTWMVVKDRYYLIHVYRARLDYPQLKRKIIQLKDEYNPRKVLIEDKASGSSLIQDLENEYGRYFEPYLPPAGMDKIMRLHTQTDLFENEKIYLPKDAPWLMDYRLELTTFPGSKYDDQVDSTTQALAYLRLNYTHKMALWAKLAG